MHGRISSLVFVFALGALTAGAQQPAQAPQPQGPQQQAASNPAPAPAQQAPAAGSPAEPQTPAANRKIHVFISYVESWNVGRVRHRSSGAGRGHAKETDSPEVADVIKEFHERCPEITVTQVEEKASYFLTLTHEQRKGLLASKNKVILTNVEGDVLFSNSTRLFTNSVKEACNAIKKDLRLPVSHK